MLTQLGLTPEQMAQGFDVGKIVKSRFDKRTIGKRDLYVLLAKGQNPIALARTFDYIAHLPGENKGIVINDDDLEDNIQNSESTCWLYDCDFRYLTHPSIGQIIFAGPRRYDQMLRAKMAGINESKVTLVEQPEDAAKALRIQDCGDVFLLYEMYRTKDSAVIKKELIEMMEGDAANEN